MLNLNVISKCVAKCKAKYLENIQIPKVTTPTAVASNQVIARHQSHGTAPSAPHQDAVIGERNFGDRLAWPLL